MKILLIEQVRNKKTSYQRFEKNILTTFSILPTLYVRRMASILSSQHQVIIGNERYDPIHVSSDFDLVIIHFTTASAYNAYALADRFREKKVVVVLCGLHASALPDEGLDHADSILLGRSEGTVLDLIDDLSRDSIKRMYPPRPYDSFSIPATDVDLPGFVMMGAVEATRGCPYQCGFCPEANTTMGNSFYARPVDEVVEEISTISQKIVMFYDASLTIDPSYAKQLFEKMIPLGKRFFCNGNVNILSEDDELVYLSKRAGCIGWLVGFESVSQETINAVNKKTNQIDAYKSAVDLIHSAKMAVIGDFMFGFDLDTPSVFQHTFSALNELNIDAADFSILTPFPGTPVFDQFERENRILTRDWSKYSMHNVVFQPKQMSPGELKKGVEWLYAQFYQPVESIKRVSTSLSFGCFPFAAMLSRNIISMMASHHL